MDAEIKVLLQKGQRISMKVEAIHIGSILSFTNESEVEIKKIGDQYNVWAKQNDIYFSYWCTEYKIENIEEN